MRLFNRNPVPRSPLVEVRELAHEQNRRQFYQIDWEEEEAREEVLSIWRENRSFDGIYISRDEEAWNQLKSFAMREWEYRYEGVLGGTGNTFGVEIEFELPRHVGAAEVARALYRADILDTTSVSRYHGSNPGPGIGDLRQMVPWPMVLNWFHQCFWIGENTGNKLNKQRVQ